MTTYGGEPGFHTTAAGKACPLHLTAALLCALLLLGTTAGCSTSTPQQAVGDFVAARIAGDERRAAELTLERDLRGYLGGEPFLYRSDVAFYIEPPGAEEDRAVVVVRYSWDDQSVDIPYVARKDGKKWRVSLRETEGLWLPDSEVKGEPPTP